MVLHGQPPAKAKIAITAEDAGIQGVLSPEPQVLPAQDWALLTQIPLSARTAEGLTQLASHLKVRDLQSPLTPPFTSRVV